MPCFHFGPYAREQSLGIAFPSNEQFYFIYTKGTKAMIVTDTINIVVKIPLDTPKESRKHLALHVIAEILRRRDWSKPQDTRATFKPEGYDSDEPFPNRAEFHMVITSKMKSLDLSNLAVTFLEWMMKI